jgi:RHS repeat-associated protein
MEGQTLAMRKAGTLYHILGDHLGSTHSVADASGTILSTEKYWPFGGQRLITGTAVADREFTGQRHETVAPGLDTYNYGARFYSTVLGRFLSADTYASSGPMWSRRH